MIRFARLRAAGDGTGGVALSAVHVKIESMSRPNPRQPVAAMPASFAGAIDLSALKNRPAPGAEGAPAAAPADAGPPSPFVIDVDEASFGQVLQASSQVLVVVDLWATWAEAGRPLSQALQRLAAAAGGSWILARVDVDANPRIAQAFAVQTLPMVIALAQGQPITDPLTQVVPETAVRQWITSLLDALRDHLPGIKEAEAKAGTTPDEASRSQRTHGSMRPRSCLANGDYAAAELAYQQILAVEPGNAEAKAALAQTGLLSRVEQLAPDVVALADAAPDDVQAQRDAADAQLAGGDVEGAFARLVNTVRRDCRGRPDGGPGAPGRTVHTVPARRSAGHQGPPRPGSRAVLSSTRARSRGGDLPGMLWKQPWDRATCQRSHGPGAADHLWLSRRRPAVAVAQAAHPQAPSPGGTRRRSRPARRMWPRSAADQIERLVGVGRPRTELVDAGVAEYRRRPGAGETGCADGVPGDRRAGGGGDRSACRELAERRGKREITAAAEAAVTPGSATPSPAAEAFTETAAASRASGSRGTWPGSTGDCWSRPSRPRVSDRSSLVIDWHELPPIRYPRSTDVSRSRPKPVRGGVGRRNGGRVTEVQQRRHRS